MSEATGNHHQLHSPITRSFFIIFWKDCHKKKKKRKTVMELSILSLGTDKNLAQEEGVGRAFLS